MHVSGSGEGRGEDAAGGWLDGDNLGGGEEGSDEQEGVYDGVDMHNIIPRGGNRGVPREQVPARIVAKTMKKRANGADSIRNIHEAGSQWGYCEY